MTRTPRPRVLVVVGLHPLWTAGAGTFINDVLVRAGGINVAAAVHQYAPFSKEALLTHPPDMILADSGEVAAMRADPVFGNLGAVRAGRFFFDRPGSDLTPRPAPGRCAASGRPCAPSGGEVKHTRIGLALSLVFAVLFFSTVVALGIGDAHLGITRVLRSLQNGPHTSSSDGQIVWLVRMPRIVMAALVGASLATAGVAFQSLLRNDLADPYLVGVSAGASVGAEAVLLRGEETLWHGLAVPAAAFVTATAAMTVVYSLARRGGRVVVTSLLLGGVVISAFLGSIATLLLELGHPEDAQRIQYRLNGSLQDATFAQCAVLSVFLFVGMFILLLEARSMNLFSLGEESAQHLGVEVERFKTVLIGTGALLTAATVAFAGIIGFVGLMVPHIARRCVGTPDHRRVLPFAAFAGAVLMVWADALARTALPGGRELPVGLVTAFLGGPFFLYLLRRHSHQG